MLLTTHDFLLNTEVRKKTFVADMLLEKSDMKIPHDFL
jgi:hypothetical protein